MRPSARLIIIILNTSHVMLKTYSYCVFSTFIEAKNIKAADFAGTRPYDEIHVHTHLPNVKYHFSEDVGGRTATTKFAHTARGIHNIIIY